MAEYKRMVSYMYQYENGVKKKNVGYARVESRNGQCRVTLHMQLVGLVDGIFPIYMIQRKSGKTNLVYLGDGVLRNQMLDSRLVSNASNIMNSGYALSDMGGILLFLNEKVFFATEWDDKPIILKELLEALNEKEEVKEEKPIQPSDKKLEKEDSPLKAQKSDREEEDSLVCEAEVKSTWEGMPIYKLPRGWKTVERTLGLSHVKIEKEAQPTEEEEKLETSDSSEKEEEIEASGLSEKEEEIEASDSSDTEEEIEVSDSSDKEERMEISDSLEEEEALEVSHSLDQEEKLELSSSTKKEKRPEEADAPYIYGKRKHQSTRYPREGVNLRRPSRGGDRKEHPAAEKIFNQYQRTFPFDDKEITKCVKIEPKDIRLLPAEMWALSNNSFLLHGFYCYNHLIFAKQVDGSNSRYILGVPGIYHNRERFMAKMFGFENFKPVRKGELKQSDFGYWYLPVNF